MTEDMFGDLIVWTVFLCMAVGVAWIAWTIYMDSI